MSSSESDEELLESKRPSFVQKSMISFLKKRRGRPKKRLAKYKLPLHSTHYASAVVTSEKEREATEVNDKEDDKDIKPRKMKRVNWSKGSASEALRKVVKLLMTMERKSLSIFI